MADLSDTVLPIVPFLRRHARLLTGSQEVGDEYVRLCLEMIVAEPERVSGENSRLQVFKAFHAGWSAIVDTLSDQRHADGETLTDRVDQGLAALPSAERRVLLLVVVEGFQIEEAGRILDRPVDEVTSLLQAAREDLGRQASVDVLVIEDEPMIAMEVSQIVTDMGHNVVAMANREDAAVAAAEDKRPGLVLADIQLLDEDNGIAAAQRILERFDVPVVFVTGFPERLLTGDAMEPAFVVSKPFEPDILRVTIAQALSTYSGEDSAAEHRAIMLEKLRSITGLAASI